MNPKLSHLTFQLSDVSIHAVAAGPQDGPLLILLHGFPEFWYGWHAQILPLAEAGFRVVVPDQRGYNLSSKPQDWQAYEISCLTSDVFAIADQLSRPRFSLVGHDWGGAVAWGCALSRPERLERVAILNAPHPRVMVDYIRTHPTQLLRSSYMLFLQLPRLPEFLLGLANFWLLALTAKITSLPGTFSEQDLKQYREAWRQPGALTGMVNWYRGLRAKSKNKREGARSSPTIDIPVKILWGTKDRFLESAMAELSLRYCPKGELTLVPGAGHWLQHEEPALVTQALKDFFATSGK